MISNPTEKNVEGYLTIKHVCHLVEVLSLNNTKMAILGWTY